jgi:hypothetical protein
MVGIVNDAAYTAYNHGPDYRGEQGSEEQKTIHGAQPRYFLESIALYPMTWIL